MQHDDFADHYDAANANLKEDASSEPSLEDLCRAHLVRLGLFIDLSVCGSIIISHLVALFVVL